MDLSGNLIDGRYQLTGQLGQGGMGAVYRALDVLLSREVAIKLLLTETSCPESQKRFAREAKILAGLDCDHIVRFLDWGIWNNQVEYLVMELLEGESLSDFLRREKRLDWRESFGIGIQICEGLEALHINGIVHRDLSPSNLFLCGANAHVVKVIDMGLASAATQKDKVEQLTKTGHLIGSLHYLSPEICSGGKSTPRSDIYALGCILYELISGTKAVEADNPMAIVYKHTNGNLVPLGEFVMDIPEMVEQVIACAVEKKAEDRFQSAAQLKEALQGCLVGGSGRQRSPSPKKCQASQFGLATGALLLAAVVWLTTIRTSLFQGGVLPETVPPVSAERLVVRSDNFPEQMGVLASRGTSAATLEQLSLTWIMHRRRGDKLFQQYRVSTELARLYRKEGDKTSEARIWTSLLDLARKEKLPTTDLKAQDERKVLVLACLEGLINLSVSQDEANDRLRRLIEEYRDELGGFRNIGKYKQEGHAYNVVYADYFLHSRLGNWERAIHAQQEALSLPPRTYQITGIVDMAYFSSIKLPSSVNSQELSILERSARFCKKTLADPDVTIYESSPHYWDIFGKSPNLVDGDIIEADIYLFGKTLAVVEYGVVQQNLALARDWLGLLQGKRRVNNQFLEQVIDSYADHTVGTKQYERLSWILRSMPKKANAGTKDSLINAQILRLCVLYPSFCLQEFGRHDVEAATGLICEALNAAEDHDNSVLEDGRITLQQLAERYYISLFSHMSPVARQSLFKHLSQHKLSSRIGKILQKASSFNSEEVAKRCAVKFEGVCGAHASESGSKAKR